MSDTSLHQANILDPIHPGLDERVWDDHISERPRLKPKHRQWIQRTVTDALEKAGYEDVDHWLSLVFTGSLTTYQYSEESDVDVSLFVNTTVFPDWSRAEIIGIMVGEIDGTILPGTPFPMQCFVVPPDVTRKDLYQPGLRSGYDLDADEWIVPPDRSRVHDVKAEMYANYAYALESADKMEKLLKYEPDKAIQFWHQIHKRRRRDHQAGKGDYSQSNIVYKMLANRGLFPQISEVSGEYIASTKLACACDTDGCQGSCVDCWKHGMPCTKCEGTDLVPEHGWWNRKEANAPVCQQCGEPMTLSGEPGVGKKFNPYKPITTPNDPESYGQWVKPYWVCRNGHSLMVGNEGYNSPEQNAGLTHYPYEVPFLQGLTPKQGAGEAAMDPPWRLDPRAVDKAATHLGIRQPCEVRVVGGTHGRYAGIEDGKHVIEAVWWLNPKRANEQIWHELQHALQAENGMTFTERPEAYDDYAAEDHEVEARGVGQSAPFSVVIPTKVAAPRMRECRKFVFDATTGELEVGELGPEEGVLPSHSQLITSLGIDPLLDPHCLGTISRSGYVQFEGGKYTPKQRAACEQALKQALPNEIEGFIGGETTIINDAGSPDTSWDFGTATQVQPGAQAQPA